MIIDARAPTRIDLAGGTLDLWPLHLFFDGSATINLGIDLWASTHLEAVISGTPNATLRAEDQRFEQQVPWQVILGDDPLKLPPQLELHGKLLRFFAKKRRTPPQGSLLVQTQARSPAGAGLGGSSTLSVSLAGALAAWSRDGESPNVAEEGEDLVAIVRDIETTVIRVPAGVQDYYGAMFGGLQSLQWNPGKHSRQAFPDATLEELDEKALVDILTRPKNALTKQYVKLFEYDGVQLEFEPEAIEAIAREAIKRNTGARGLRAILEQSMLEVMYELPAMSEVKKCVVTVGSITRGERPRMVLADGTQAQPAASRVPEKAESA